MIKRTEGSEEKKGERGGCSLCFFQFETALSAKIYPKSFHSFLYSKGKISFILLLLLASTTTTDSLIFIIFLSLSSFQ